MTARAIRYALLIIGAAMAYSGCSRKSPAEIEAEKARADAAWDAQAAVAERARQQEENRLLSQQMAAHAHSEQLDDQRDAETDRERENRERERLIEAVRSRSADPRATRFADVHWNSSRSAVCGAVSLQSADGAYTQYRQFIVNADNPTIDSDDAAEHSRFEDAAAAIDCTP